MKKIWGTIALVAWLRQWIQGENKATILIETSRRLLREAKQRRLLHTDIFLAKQIEHE
jgi:Fe-S cluster biosynthesis and repair protein YggX